jgi:MFS family permease
MRERSGASPAFRPTARPSGPWVLAATIIGSSLAFIDGTVVSVALPAIAREFAATGSEVQWVVEAYALSLSALLPRTVARWGTGSDGGGSTRSA